MTPQEAREILSKINISVGMGESFNLSENQILEATSMAIEALEQQPCEDCISRQRVLNDLENVIKGSEHPRQVFVFVDECVDYITSVPSVTPKAEWIPVSKELPKENEYIGDVCKYYLIQDEYGDMHVAHLSNVGWMPMESLKAIGSEIMAWRELPKPYRESEDEE